MADLKSKNLKPISIEVLKASKAKNEYPRVWDTVKNLLPGLCNKHVAMMVSVAVGVCSDCFEGPIGHNCSYNG